MKLTTKRKSLIKQQTAIFNGGFTHQKQQISEKASKR